MVRGLSKRVLGVCCLLSGLAWGCGPRGDVIEVKVCGDVVLPEEVDAVRVSVLDAERNELRAGTRELVLCPQDRLLTLPQTVEFEGVDAVNAWVVVQGLKDGVSVMSYERRATLSTSLVEQVTMALTRDCIGVQCTLGQTCVDGQCEIVTEQPPVGACEAAVVLDPDVMPAEEMMPSEEDEMMVESGPLYCPAPPEMSEDEEEA